MKKTVFDIKHQVKIEINDNEIEFSEEEQRYICIGKDLMGNRYKVYFNKDNLVEDTVQIHFVRGF